MRPSVHEQHSPWPPRPGVAAALSGAEQSFRPMLYNAGTPEGRAEVEQLLAEGRVVAVQDSLWAQLEDLAEALEPREVELSRAERAERARALLGGQPEAEYGTWVYYPWSGSLVHVLPCEAYRRLRADRNRLRITGEQQKLLGSTWVAVAGLSVGRAAALTLALEGVGGRFHLADMDALALSNLNRLQAGVQQLGVNKALLAARALAELDPYLEVEVFTQGVTEHNLEDFLGGVDLLVEECDDLTMKVRLRERARELRIPVLMETSDRGLLDVERYDLEPHRPLLHGLVGEVRAEQLAGLSGKEKVPFVLRVLQPERASAALLASLVELKTSVYTWPQLGSAVALGGAVVADVGRRVLLGEPVGSGRYYVDVGEQVREGAQVALRPPEPVEPPAGPAGPVEVGPRPVGRQGEVSEEEVRWLVAHAVLAPSGGNAQPWRFRWARGVLEAQVDPGRSRALLDWQGTASYVALGGALACLEAAAAVLGLRAEVERLPEPTRPLLAWRARLVRGEPVPGAEERLERLRLRVTNRRRGDGRRLEEAHAAALQEAVGAGPVRLQWLRRQGELAEAGALLGRVDRLLFQDEELHREMMAEVRWTAAGARATRDGLELATLELGPADEAALQVLRRWPAMEYLRRSGAGAGLEVPARKATEAAAAVGLLTCEGTGAASYLEGGRVLARVWAEASARGLAFQPHSPVTFLFSRLLRGWGEGLSERVCQELRGLRKSYEQLFTVSENEAEVLLFRLSYAGPPTARSLRRRVEEVLTVDLT